MQRPINYYFLIPLIGAIPWGGMLIAMLVAWSIQGHPIYWFIHRHQMPVYISHIGATNLQPLFISCSGWQGILYIITLFTEYTLRRQGRLQFWFKKSERNLLFGATISGAVGQLGLLMCSIFNTKDYTDVHHAMLVVFIVFILVSMICLICDYYLMGIHYRTIHVTHKRFNKFFISFILKVIWTIIAIVCALCFEKVDDKDVSAYFEWILAFWYLALFCVFAYDLYPAAKKEHKNFPYIKEWNEKGFYLYDKHYGQYANVYEEELHESGSETLPHASQVFDDEQLQQFPIKGKEDAYPMDILDKPAETEPVETYQNIEPPLMKVDYSAKELPALPQLQTDPHTVPTIPMVPSVQPTIPSAPPTVKEPSPPMVQPLPPAQFAQPPPQFYPQPSPASVPPPTQKEYTRKIETPQSVETQPSLEELERKPRRVRQLVGPQLTSYQGERATPHSDTTRSFAQLEKYPQESRKSRSSRQG